MTRIETYDSLRDVTTTEVDRRDVPEKVRALPLGEKMRWARKTAGLSHDRLVKTMGRSNRGHAIKVEQGVHHPRPDLRDAWADATNVPRGLFEDEEAALSGDTFRDGNGSSGSPARARRAATKSTASGKGVKKAA